MNPILKKYTFIKLNNILLDQARFLIIKYGKVGLRTLDSIQLSTAVFLKSDVNLFFTSDIILLKLFENEHLKVV